MKCELCHEREAETVIFRERKGKAREELYVCRECAAREGAFGQERGIQVATMDVGEGELPPGMNPGKPPKGLETLGLPPKEAREALGALGKLFGEMADSLGEEEPVRCPRCGTTLEDVRTHGVVGCAHCYQFFKKALEPLFADVHGCTRYVQSTAERRQEALQQAVEQAKRAMHQAAMAENYAAAKAYKQKLEQAKQALDEAKAGAGTDGEADQPLWEEAMAFAAMHAMPARLLEAQRMAAFPTWSPLLGMQIAVVRNVRGAPFPDKMAEGAAERFGKQLVEAVLRAQPDFAVCTEDAATLEEADLVRHLTPKACRKPAYALLRTQALEILGRPIWCEVMSANHLTFSLSITAEEMALDACGMMGNLLLEFVDGLDERLGYAKDRQFGYLTQQLSLVGSGFRIRSWVHLAGLTHFGQLQETCNAANFVGQDIDIENPEAAPQPGHVYILFNRRTLAETPAHDITAHISFLITVLNQELAARRRLEVDEPFILLDIVRRLQAAFQAALLMGVDEAKDCLSDFYLALSLRAIKPRLAVKKLPRPDVIERMHEEILPQWAGAEAPEPRPLPAAVRDFEPWKRDALRAAWIQRVFSFTVSPELERRAMQ